MAYSWIFRTDAALLCGALFLAMIAAAGTGRLVGARRARGGAKAALGGVEGGLYGLFGLLLAFTFGMAAARFDGARKLVVEEANAIGTAALRADLYPDADRAAFLEDFRRYLDARIAFHGAGVDAERIAGALRRTDEGQRALWARATRLAREPGSVLPGMQMIPALNAAFDMESSVMASLRARVPDAIVVLLLVLAVAVAFMNGYAAGLSGQRDRLAAVGFAVLTVLVVYVILDVDRPRRGLTSIDVAQQSLLDLRERLFGAPPPGVPGAGG
jgi:hypothetical protein